MTQFPKSFTRRRYEEMNLRRARGQNPTSCLKDCEQLSTECCDNEVTYFHQFILLKASETSTRPGYEPNAWGWAQLPRARALMAQPAARRDIASKVRALKDRLQERPDIAPGVKGLGGERSANGGAREETARRRLPEKASVQRIESLAMRQLALPSDNTVVITPLIDSMVDLFNLLGIAPGMSLAAAGALWAIGVEYEQVWNCRGYRRGRLLRSIPLTPGEQLEVVTKTWDKQTVRSTLLESVERNISTEVTGEQKWTQATKNTFVNQTNAGVNPTAGVNAEVELPIKVINVGGGGNLGLSGQLSAALSQTMETSSEYVQTAMMKAANSLKAVRTNSVETVHEIGTEVTSKQTISNTNRCHSLTYHYFEVLEDFEVTTRPVGASVFLLLPLPVPTITLDWVLCHECTLRQVLPCATFYRGLEAARLLKTQEIRAHYFLGAKCPSSGTQPNGGAGTTADDGLDVFVNSVLLAYGMLANANILAAPNRPDEVVGAKIDAFFDIGFRVATDLLNAVKSRAEQAVEATLNEGSKVVEAAKDVFNDVIDALPDPPAPGPQPRLPNAQFIQFSTLPGLGTTEGGPGSWMFWTVVAGRTPAVAVAPELRDALAYLDSAWKELALSNPSPAQAATAKQLILDQFLGRLGNLDVLFAKIDGALAIVTAGVAIGMNPLYGPAVVLALLAMATALEVAGIGDTIPDDEGLKNKLLALKAKFEAVKSVGPIVAAPGPSDLVAVTDPNDPCANRYCADPCALAEARVEWERLACHLTDELTHYAQAIWMRWKDGHVMALAESFGIPLGAIEYRFSGFHGNRGAVRVVDTEWLKTQGGFDWDSELAKALASLPEAPDPDLITLPTQGMIVEPALGKCDGCEPFIQAHRNLDLDNRRAEVDLQKAKALQQAHEAERFKQRLTENNLDDPTPFEGTSVSVDAKAP